MHIVEYMSLCGRGEAAMCNVPVAVSDCYDETQLWKEGRERGGGGQRGYIGTQKNRRRVHSDEVNRGHQLL